MRATLSLWTPFESSSALPAEPAYTIPRPASLDATTRGTIVRMGPLVTRVLNTLYGLRVSRWASPQTRGRLGIGGRLRPRLECSPHSAGVGWRVFGIERNEAAAETARQTLGPNTIATSMVGFARRCSGRFNRLFQASGISATLALLRECARRLASGGLLIANVPNFSACNRGLPARKWIHLDVPPHTSFITPRDP